MLANKAKSRAFTRDSLLKGKDQFDLPSYTNKFRSAALQNETIFFLFFKTTYSNEEVNCTKPFPSVRLPCMYYETFNLYN